ncbi:BTB/POZ domain-containing protein [Platanthera zijinensis]|uniref:BTB/POZ domain-containing protein n=1 Tax=Platanthera zijinensis TaxID=2320716 RepID=A0AAP0BIY0_9ASPA
MRRACKGLDRRLIEDGLSNTILTLLLAIQQDILLAWFIRFLNYGDDCPNIQQGFEVWWRRSFWRQNGETSRPTQLRISAAFVPYCDQIYQSTVIVVDKLVDDDNNWRKYGQKQVKGKDIQGTIINVKAFDLLKVDERVNKSVESGNKAAHAGCRVLKYETRRSGGLSLAGCRPRGLAVNLQRFDIQVVAIRSPAVWQFISGGLETGRSSGLLPHLSLLLLVLPSD